MPAKRKLMFESATTTPSHPKKNTATIDLTVEEAVPPAMSSSTPPLSPSTPRSPDIPLSGIDVIPPSPSPSYSPVDMSNRLFLQNTQLPDFSPVDMSTPPPVRVQSPIMSHPHLPPPLVLPGQWPGVVRETILSDEEDDDIASHPLRIFIKVIDGDLCPYIRWDEVPVYHWIEITEATIKKRDEGNVIIVTLNNKYKVALPTRYTKLVEDMGVETFMAGTPHLLNMGLVNKTGFSVRRLLISALADLNAKRIKNVINAFRI